MKQITNKRMHSIIKESVKNVLAEATNTYDDGAIHFHSQNNDRDRSMTVSRMMNNYSHHLPTFGEHDLERINKQNKYDRYEKSRGEHGKPKLYDLRASLNNAANEAANLLNGYAELTDEEKDLLEEIFNVLDDYTRQVNGMMDEEYQDDDSSDY